MIKNFKDEEKFSTGSEQGRETKEVGSDLENSKIHHRSRSGRRSSRASGKRNSQQTTSRNGSSKLDAIANSISSAVNTMVTHQVDTNITVDDLIYTESTPTSFPSTLTAEIDLARVEGASSVPITDRRILDYRETGVTGLRYINNKYQFSYSKIFGYANKNSNSIPLSTNSIAIDQELEDYKGVEMDADVSTYGEISNFEDSQADLSSSNSKFARLRKFIDKLKNDEHLIYVKDSNYLQRSFEGYTQARNRLDFSSSNYLHIANLRFVGDGFPGKAVFRPYEEVQHLN